MAVVVGNICLAKMEVEPGNKAFEKLVKAEKASIQTKALTARLITFSQGEGPIKKIVSIGDLLKDSVGSLLEGSDISCKCSIPDDISPAEIDVEQMIQVIHIIATNAQEAMAGEGTISVSCENVDIGVKDTLALKKGKHVKISINDQGSGMPQEILERIFEPYFSTKEMGSQKGVGLGLAISDSIIKKHGGLITVESQLGNGTTVSIYLPAISEERKAQSALEESAPHFTERDGIEVLSTIDNHQSSIQRVLVMDDEESVRDVASSILTRFGYEVAVAIEGLEAIEMYRKAMASGNPFDVVILDLTNKTGLGGIETIERLLEIDTAVKAIVRTGYSNNPVLRDFRGHGFRAALLKPFTFDELKAAFREIRAGG